MYTKLLVIMVVLVYLIYIQTYIGAGIWGIGSLIFLYFTQIKRKEKSIDDLAGNDDIIVFESD